MKTNGRYILKGKKPVPCADLMEWARAMESQNRHVAKTKGPGCKISTVFLGLDHSFGEGKPLLFETMVFGGKFDQETNRYSTWDEAEAGHIEMCIKFLGLDGVLLIWDDEKV